MFNRLKQKWKVSWLQFVLIFLTFALGGSLCGYLGRILLNLTGMERGVLWVVAYILLITVLWPICVLAISVFTGQFPFFRAYIQKIGKRMFSSRHAKKQP